jgi:hypothetical protein
LNGVPLFVDDEAEAPVLIKESQTIAAFVVENGDLSFAHPILDDARLDIKSTPYNSCVDAKGALFKLHYGHGLKIPSAAGPSSIFYSQQELESQIGAAISRNARRRLVVLAFGPFAEGK